ncbi:MULTISPECIES: TIGR02611 family protein [Mycolicibacterium]|jgi:uncharacterized protein (TIGR02611 family)|uniref:TIGR02611 family protein n=2 Tax=Mycolicibacterium septicum TaxID=98668 RepID=A0A7X6MKT6_9MYCO|nr:TIGR02611 family protein [Mycolicibacterium septicum]MDF3336357.1 TIGR02611 family protein [Mycolicibacterium septicum]NKZ09588.1 TIGR02611 family protein [Mycolicibacterium septicum DSM 44393]SEQ31208.1 TIGR02611 family protein [Mycobacterium sp. 88mf]SFF44387.1 TIGR02611 family protein [Mycobacterium sp. 455mf]
MSLATNLAEVKRRWTSWRERLRSRRAADFTYRIVVGVVGTIVLAVGIVAIPYPGPGWAIVFLGLAILASEFDFAKRALRYVRARYDAVMAWFDRQHIAVKGVSAAFTGLVVIGTLWLFGVIGWSAGLVGLEQQWLKSPIGLGS